MVRKVEKRKIEETWGFLNVRYSKFNVMQDSEKV